MFTRTFVFACSLAALTGVPALAQTETPAPDAPATTEAPAAEAPAAEAPAAGTSPMADPEAAYLAARNQLGVLQYCQDQGHIGADAAATQTTLIGMLPQGDAAAGDEAEAKGKAGTISAMGTETTLAEGAAAQNTTEQALCQQMEAMMAQMAEQLPG